MASFLKWRPFQNSKIDELIEEMQPAARGKDVPVDMYRENHSLIIKLHVPGISPDKIDILVEDDYLQVKGNREDDIETEDQQYYYREIKSGSFTRTVQLPVAVMKTETRAEYKDGVLRIVLPIKGLDRNQSTKVKVEKK